jgi:hypothetical protein
MWKIMTWLNFKLRDGLFMGTVINVVPLLGGMAKILELPSD